MDTQTRREMLRRMLEAAVAAVDPEKLTYEALADEEDTPVTLIAIGKASTAMCRGAARRLSQISGVCVAIDPDLIPQGVELIVGDHPIPGEGSFVAGRRVLEVASHAPDKILALISGGGSALCEHPIDGVSRRFIEETNKALLSSGASIAQTNLVRRHLSAVKGGGLVKAAGRPIDTYAISDVCGADPSVIASGPTVPVAADPDMAKSIMVEHGIDIPAAVSEALFAHSHVPARAGKVRVVADGRTAANAAAKYARARGLPVSVSDDWLRGPVAKMLDRFIDDSGPDLTIDVGEPEVAVSGDGFGGRNTHAALLAATRIAGTESVFAAFATDGVDGNSASAGAIVDGATVARGGDPISALERSDSASYLRHTGDLIEIGPTGTNVSDLWIMWR